MLEERINALIVALNENTAALLASKTSEKAAVADTVPVTPKKLASKTPASGASDTANAPTVATSAPAAAVAETAAKPTAEDSSSAGQTSDPFEYKTLQKSVLELVQKDQATAVAILGKFGVRKATELTPAQWPVVFAEFEQALGRGTVEELA